MFSIEIIFSKKERKRFVFLWGGQCVGSIGSSLHGRFDFLGSFPMYEYCRDAL